MCFIVLCHSYCSILSKVSIRWIKGVNVSVQVYEQGQQLTPL